MSELRFEHPTLTDALAFLENRKRWSLYSDTSYKDAILCQRVVTLARESVAERNVIEGQLSIEDQQMPQEREAPQMGSFFKFQELGQAVAGKVAKYAVHDKNGPFITMSPVIIWPSKGEQPQRFLTCAIGLSQDLRLKIHADDVGKFISMSFREKEPTTKGSPLKRFRVEELSLAEITELANANVNDTCKALPYTTQLPQSADDDDKADDDLPF